MVVAYSRTADKWLQDRKSTRLNSSHLGISYAVFCLTTLPPTPPLFPYTTLFRSFSGKPSIQLFASRPSISYLTAVNHSTAVNACILRPLDGLQHIYRIADRDGGCI